MILLALALPAAACQLLAVVGPDDDSLAVPFPATVADGRVLSRGSLVRSDVALSCGADTVPVTVVAENAWYRELGATHAQDDDLGCIARPHLQPLAGRVLAPQPPPAGQVATGRGPVTVRDGACHGDLVETDVGSVPLTDLRWHRTRTPDQADAIDRVQAAWSRHFPGSAPVAWSDWGRVSLPLVHERTAEELAAVWQAEGLDTTERREKAVVATGPEQEGLPLWAHFLGSDAPRSDRWGQPGFVAALIDLAASWWTICQTAEPTMMRHHCTMQIGDLAFPSPRDPDPLGHRDHDGSCVDLRLWRSDGSHYEAWWNRGDDRPGFSDAYDPAPTTAFLTLVAGRATALHFNDPAVIAAVPGLAAARGHDDHLHLCLAP